MRSFILSVFIMSQLVSNSFHLFLVFPQIFFTDFTNHILVYFIIFLFLAGINCLKLLSVFFFFGRNWSNWPADTTDVKDKAIFPTGKHVELLEGIVAFNWSSWNCYCLHAINYTLLIRFNAITRSRRCKIITGIINY